MKNLRRKQAVTNFQTQESRMERTDYLKIISDLKTINRIRLTDIIPLYHGKEHHLLDEMQLQILNRFCKTCDNRIDYPALDKIVTEIRWRMYTRYLLPTFVFLPIALLFWCYSYSLLAIGVALFPAIDCLGPETTANFRKTGIKENFKKSPNQYIRPIQIKIDSLSNKDFIKCLGVILSDENIVDKIFRTFFLRPTKKAYTKDLETLTKFVNNQPDEPLTVERQDREGRVPKGRIKREECANTNEDKKDDDKKEEKDSNLTNVVIVEGLGGIFQGSIHRVPADGQVFGKNAFFFAAFSRKFKLGTHENLYTSYLYRATVGTNNKHNIKYINENEIVLNVDGDKKPIAREYKADEFGLWVEKVMGDKSRASAVCNKLFAEAGGKENFRFLIFNREQNHAQRGY